MTCRTADCIARSKTLTRLDHIKFDKMDTNHNGLLDRAEAKKGKMSTSVFNKIDIKPKSGKISFKEYDTYYHKLHGLA